MNKRKLMINTFIFLISVIIIKVIFESIGMDNISAQVFNMFLLLSCTVFIVPTLKNKDKGLGAKYNITLSILMILMCISIGIGVTIAKCYPDLFNKYFMIILMFVGVSFFGLIIFIVISRLIYEKNRQ